MSLVWSEAAAGFLRDLVAFMKERGATKAAKKIVKRLRTRVRSLLRFPKQGRPALGLPPSSRLRELVVDSFIVTYELKSNGDVEILWIRHGKQDPLHDDDEDGTSE